MSSMQTPQKRITLEDITQRKAKVLDEIRTQKKAMTKTTRRIFAPLAPAASGTGALMHTFNTGMAIFDGVMLGLKIMKKIRQMFRKK